MRSLQVTFLSDFLKCGVLESFLTPSQQGTATLPEKSLLQPEGSAICSLPLCFGVFFFFLVVYKGSKPSKLIYCVGSYHLLRVGKRITAPLNIRFQRETRNVMSLLSPLSSVHMYTHSSTLNMQQRTCI